VVAGYEKHALFSILERMGLLGVFAAEDEIRPESKEVVEELHRLGIRVAMISGGSKTVAGLVAGQPTRYRVTGE
jgi:Cu2+-exporting ATPase